MSVQAGTQLSFQFSGNAQGLGFSVDFWNATDKDQLRTDLIARMIPYMQVVNITVDDSGLLDPGTWTYVATMVVKPKGDYGSQADVASVIAHALYELTGYMPSTSLLSEGDPGQPGADKDTAKFPDLTLVIIVVGLIAVAVILGQSRAILGATS